MRGTPESSGTGLRIYALHSWTRFALFHRSRRGDDSRKSVVLRENLADEVLGHLYRMGVPWSGLDITAESTSGDVTPLMADAVADTANAARVYAQLLVGPEQDMFTLEPPERLRRQVEFTPSLALPGTPVAGVADLESQVLAGVREGQSLDQLARSTELTTELVRMMLERRRQRLGREQEQIDAALKANPETAGE